MVRTYSRICMELRRRLAVAEPETALSVSRELTAKAAGKTLEELLRDLHLLAPDSASSLAEEYLEEYMAGKPLAYILGEWSFYGLPMKVTEDVLIPRDDTTTVTDLALEMLMGMDKPRVLDLCTGSGCIGIAVAKRVPTACVTLADISYPALDIAQENAARNQVSRRMNFVHADALQPAPGFLSGFDLIISNPPYITGEEMGQLDVSVREYEPHLALFGGEDGLDFYRAICRNYREVLKPEGYLCFEFGLGQELAVGEILKVNGFGELRFERDASNIVRAVIARKKERN